MTRMLSMVLVLLFLLSIRVVADGPTPQEQYLKVYLRINDADQLEKEGNFRQAYLTFSDCLLKLIVMRDDPDWQQELINKRIVDCDSTLHRLKTQILQKPLPALDDKAEVEFLSNLTQDLHNWEKIKGKQPEWLANVIANRISDDKAILTASR